MSVNSKIFKKSDMDFYLNELGKELKKEYGKHASFELILVGGGAVAMQYEFRNATTDLDALLSSSISSAINKITDMYQLPNGWLNTDFTKTTSYSPKIREHSKYYRRFSNVLEVRMISDEYLIAMKIRAFRQYRHDISDIVGIVSEMKSAGRELSISKVEQAFRELYGKEESIPEPISKFVSNVIKSDDLKSIYKECVKREEAAYNAVLLAQEEMSPMTLEKYINTIINDKTSEEMEDFLSRVNNTNEAAESDMIPELWEHMKLSGYFSSYQILDGEEGKKMRLEVADGSNTNVVVDIDTKEFSIFKSDRRLTLFDMISNHPYEMNLYTSLSNLLKNIERKDVVKEIEKDFER